MKIFIDNGHGSDTAGKRSPDGRFLEYKFNHIIASGTVSALRNKGLDAELLVPEENDITLAERCRRVNGWYREHGKDSCILVSIHANAFGNGREWTSPSGWSVYTSKGQTRADKLADCLFAAAKKHLPSMKMRADWSDGDADQEEGFYILRHTLYPAVLTENGFMTNTQEVQVLESSAGQQAIINLHVEGIINFIDDTY